MNKATYNNASKMHTIIMALGIIVLCLDPSEYRRCDRIQ